MKEMKKCLLVLVSILLLNEAVSQKVVNVATQRFEEQTPFKPGSSLKLDLEKVHVSVSGHDKNSYEFQITFKSKHKDEKQAIKELGFVSYQLRQENDTLYFSNDFANGDSFRKIQGILSVELEIKAPRSSDIVIGNAYGTTQIKDITASLVVNGKFVETSIEQCEGPVSLRAVFGELLIQNHTGDLDLDLSRVNIRGDRIRGNISGVTNYGAVEISRLQTKDVEIDARKTAFSLTLANYSLPTYNLDLVSQLGSIHLEGGINKKTSNQWKSEGTSDATIRIVTSFSPILIKDGSLNARNE